MKLRTPQPLEARRPLVTETPTSPDGQKRASFDARVQAVAGSLGAGTSFDVLVRRFQVGNRAAALIFLDGFLRPAPTFRVLQSLMNAPEKELGDEPRRALEEKLVPFFEVQWSEQADAVVREVLARQAALLVEGVDP